MKSTKELENLYSVRTVAEFLDCHPRTVKRHMKDLGIIPLRTRGDHIRLNPQMVDILLQDMGRNA